MFVSNPKKGSFVLAAVVLSSLALSACNKAEPPVEPLPLSAFDYRKNHPIVITEAQENMDLPIGASTRGLSRQMKGALTAFAQQAKADGNGFIEVLIPSGAANSRAAKAIVPSMRSALKQGGAEPSKVVVRTYPVGDAQASGPVRVSYTRMKAVVKKCGQWPENLIGSPENTNYQNFGCATQANLAAMVDNPSDLIYPSASTPADGVRRDTVFKKYRGGQTTSSQVAEGDGATASDVK
ncbi:pilus assembly protein [Rhodobacteraceae bacterium RKSG542]|uniref:CpaD family pilus assembly protein n=1 Tax=Pseudovibrio flavus TaxID=2529854 RepID=UPI0012BBE0D5|nr:CpaD family pilus assembly protein [Pseudovibrio flavus]MTI17176.1 pilus assembly protein [Pseudovibrio flavus]